MESVPGVRTLDVQSDADHNRTVVTVVGTPDQVEESAYRGISSAARLIDMEQHQGEHPRMGAADVVPFVPLRGITLDECAQIAHRLGRRVGEELEIPIYLYEAAASRPERANLADVRRGEYEGIRAEIETVAERAPDFGPAKMGSAGATAIGARPFLVAFNVYLNTDDISIAQHIARAVRHSSGGLRYVKALGLLVEGQAQVSMNLTNHARTPLQRVLELIRREAANLGAAVTHTEIVGLTPQQALLDAAEWYLQLELDSGQVLESILHDDTDTAPEPFIAAVSSVEPAPGGGSVAALAGALAAALAEMVAGLTVGKRRYQEVEEEMKALAIDAERLRLALTARIAQDAAAYDRVVAAYRLPKESAKEKEARREAIQEAMAHAAEVPLATARDSVAALELARAAVAKGNINALSDVGTAAHMARAAFEGAALNVRINADQITDQERAQTWLVELDQLRARLRQLLDRTLTAMEERWTATT
jgi:glutamate formiminotransferase/formiminotetrahydrofolate cyclodeaminase